MTPNPPERSVGQLRLAVAPIRNVGARRVRHRRRLLDDRGLLGRLRAGDDALRHPRLDPRPRGDRARRVHQRARPARARRRARASQPRPRHEDRGRRDRRPRHRRPRARRRLPRRAVLRARRPGGSGREVARGEDGPRRRPRSRRSRSRSATRRSSTRVRRRDRHARREVPDPRDPTSSTSACAPRAPTRRPSRTFAASRLHLFASRISGCWVAPVMTWRACSVASRKRGACPTSRLKSGGRRCIGARARAAATAEPTRAHTRNLIGGHA
jgi:hypothetical protein